MVARIHKSPGIIVLDHSDMRGKTQSPKMQKCQSCGISTRVYRWLKQGRTVCPSCGEAYDFTKEMTNKG